MPGKTRTLNFQIRSLILYPIELQAQGLFFCIKSNNPYMDRNYNINIRLHPFKPLFSTKGAYQNMDLQEDKSWDKINLSVDGWRR